MPVDQRHYSLVAELLTTPEMSSPSSVRARTSAIALRRRSGSRVASRRAEASSPRGLRRAAGIRPPTSTCCGSRSTSGCGSGRGTPLPVPTRDLRRELPPDVAAPAPGTAPRTAARERLAPASNPHDELRRPPRARASRRWASPSTSCGTRRSAAELHGRFMHRLPGGDVVAIERPNEYTQLDLEERTAILKLHGAIDRRNFKQDSYVITEDSYIDYLVGGDLGRISPSPCSSEWPRATISSSATRCTTGTCG